MQIPIIVPCHRTSSRLPFKNRLLLPYTLNWLEQVTEKSRVYVTGNDEEILRRAKEAGFNAVFSNTDNVDQRAKEVTGSSAYILAQLTQPLRERWLLSAMDAAILSHKDKQRITTSADMQLMDWRTTGQGDRSIRNMITGALYYINPEAPNPSSPGLLHNAQTFLDIDHLHQLPSAEVLDKRFAEAMEYYPPMSVRDMIGKSVVIIGSSDSARGLKAAEWVDSHDIVIRVNHPVLNEDFGYRTTHHLTPHTACTDEMIEEAEKAGQPRPILLSTRDAIKKHTTPGLYTTDIGAFALNYLVGITNDPAFVSTGLEAIFYFLTLGVPHIDLIGFKSIDGIGKMDYRTGYVDDRTQWSDEDGLKLMLVQDGRVSHYEDTIKIDAPSSISK